MSDNATQLKAIQDHFADVVMPRVTRHAQVYFRQHRRDQELMDELTQASVSIAWKWYLRLKLKGEKEPDDFISALATRACQAVRNGRTISGQEKARSVHNRKTQVREGFVIGSLPEYDANCHDSSLLRAIQDDEASPADLAACMIDTEAWLAHLDERRRRMAVDMIAGERTGDLAEKYKTTPGRMSQIRRWLVKDNQRFRGDGEEQER